MALDFNQLKARADIPDLLGGARAGAAREPCCAVRLRPSTVVFNSPVGRTSDGCLLDADTCARGRDRAVVDVHLVLHPEARVTFRDLRSTLAGKIVTLRGQGHLASPPPFGASPRLSSLPAMTLRHAADVLRTNGLDEPEIGTEAAPGCRSKKFTPGQDSVTSSGLAALWLQELIEDVMEDDDYDGRGQARFAVRVRGDAGEQVRTRG